MKEQLQKMPRIWQNWGACACSGYAQNPSLLLLPFLLGLSLIIPLHACFPVPPQKGAFSVEKL